jgi:hypothetical protein
MNYLSFNPLVQGEYIMALSLSTGLRNGILGSGNAGDALNLLLATGEIRIFSGSAPSLADDTETGTLLVTIGTSTGSSFSCNFALTATSGVLSKAADTWDGVAVATGTAGYFRYCANTADAGGTSTSELRIQGAVATSGAELNMSSTSITSAATTTIDTFDITMPES